MWLIVMEDNLGDLARQPVLVLDDKKDAEYELKLLERKSADYFGNYPSRIYKLIPIQVRLNQENFSESPNQNSGMQK